jgi:excisionase family DNA binding protein
MSLAVFASVPPDKPSHDTWLTVSEAAAIAKVSVGTIGAALRAGHLRGHKVNGRKTWRMRRSALDAWLEGKQTGS